MATPVVLAAPLAFELAKMLFEADSNRRRHEVARLEHELEILRARERTEERAHEEIIVEKKLSFLREFVGVEAKSFEQKLESFNNIRDRILDSIEHDRQHCNAAYENLIRQSHQHDLPDHVSAAVKRELEAVNDRMRRLERFRDRMAKNLTKTLVSLKPATFLEPTRLLRSGPNGDFS